MITVIENQTLYDIATQEYGNVQAVFDLAIANGLSVTDDIIPGQKLILPTSEHFSKEISNFFKGKNIKIATGYKEPPIMPYGLPEGPLPFSL